MAKRIQIDIEVNGKMQKATVSAKKLKAALDGVESSQERVNNSQRNYDRRSKGAARATSNSTKEFSKMQQGMGGLVGAYATVAASVFALSAGFQFLKAASDLSAQQRGQELFAARTGVSMKLMTQNIQEATGGLIAFKEAAQAAAIGEAAGLSADQMERLGKVAKNAGTILGRDVTDSFNRLTRGAIKAEPELLDELGIIVRLNDATEVYAKRLGKSAQELTQFEKSQAVVNAVLEQGESKFEDVGDSINSVAKLSAAFADTFKDLADPIANVANFIAEGLTDSVLAVSAVFGLLGLSIVKSLGVAGPGFKNISKQAKNAKKSLKAAAGDSIIGKEIAAGKFEKRQLRAIENAHKAKTSTVMNLSKMEAAEIKKNLLIIKADTLRTTAENTNAFSAFFLNARAQLYTFQAEYGKVMGTLRAATAGLAKAFGMAMRVLSVVGIATIFVEIGKELRQAFFITDELARAEKSFASVTKRIEEQRDAIRDTKSSLKDAATPLDSIVQQFGVLSNFNLSPLRSQVNNLVKSFARLEEIVQIANEKTLEFGLNSDNYKNMAAQLGVETYGELASRMTATAARAEILNAELDKSKEGKTGIDKLVLDFKALFSETGKVNGELRRLEDLTRAAGQGLIKDTDFGKESKQYVNSLQQGVGLISDNLKELGEAKISVQGLNPASVDELNTLLEEANVLYNGSDVAAYKAKLEELAKSYKKNIDLTEEGNQKAAAGKAAYTSIANAVQAFGDATDKFIPKQSKFTAVYDSIDEIDRSLNTVFNTVDGAKGMTVADFVGAKDKKGFNEASSSLVRIYNLLKDGEDKVLGLSKERITVEKLLEALQNRRNEVLKGEIALERAKVKTALDYKKQLVGLPKFQQAALNSAKAQADAQNNLNAAVAHQLSQTDFNLSLSDEQKVVLQEQVDLAKEDLRLATEKNLLEQALLSVKKKQAELNAGNSLVGAEQQLLSVLQKQASTQRELLNLQESRASKSIDLNARSAAIGNSGFNKERVVAQKRLELEKSLQVEKEKAVQQEYALKVEATNLEYDLLEAKRLMLSQEMKAKALELRQSDVRDDQKLAADFAKMSGTLGGAGGGIERARAASLELLKAQRDNGLFNIGVDIANAELLVQELSFVEKIGQTFQSSLRDGIKGGIDALIEGGTNAKEVLLNMAQDTLGNLANDFFEESMDGLFNDVLGKKKEDEKTPAQKIEEALAQKNAENPIENKIHLALDEGGKKLAEEIRNAIMTAPIKAGDPTGTIPKTTGLPGAGSVSAAADAAIASTANSGATPLPGHQAVPSVFQTDTKAGGAINNMITDSMTPSDKKDGGVGGASEGLIEALTGATTASDAVSGFLEMTGTALGGNTDVMNAMALITKLVSFKEQAASVAETTASGANTTASGANTTAVAANTVALKSQALNSAPVPPLGRAGGIFSGGKKTTGYSTGGIAKGAQGGFPAILHGTEAVVPLPNGKTIPVEVSGGAGGGQQNNVSVNVVMNNDGSSNSEVSGQEAAQLGKRISLAVQNELATQKRAGGMLSPFGAT